MRLSTSLRLNAQKGLVTPYDPTLTLSLQFATRQAYVSDFGPLPTFTNATTTARTYVGSDGLLKTAGLNVPRIEFDPVTRQCLGLLIEEQRQNLCIHSENLSAANWGKSNVAVTSDTSVAPDGLSTADVVAETAVSGFHTVSTPSMTPTSGTAYALSVFLKKGPGSTAPDWIILGTSNQFPTFVVAFNVLTGQFGNVLGGASATYKAVQYANGWWRVSIVITASGSSATSPLTIYFSNNTNTVSAPSYLGNTTSNVLIWGAQVEAGAFASSYIPTTTTSLVRSADVCSITGAAFTGFYNQTEGTMVLKMDKAYPVPASISQLNYLTIGDGTVNNYIHFAQRGSGTTGEVLRVETLGSSQCFISGSSTVTAGVAFGMASRYKLNDFALSVSGATVAKDNTGSIPVVSQLDFVTYNSSNHIRSLQYFNAIKTDAQLQALSTP